MNNIAIPFVETNICKALDKLITACSNNQKDLISVAAKTCLEELKKYQNADANADGGNLQISNQRQLIDFDFKEERESWKYLVNDVQIDFSKPLGTGKFGNVFQGNYKGSKVLIKVPLNHDVLAFRNTFLNEAKMLRKLNHSNIAALRAVGVIDKNNSQCANSLIKQYSLCIVTEYWHETLKTYVESQFSLKQCMSLEEAWNICQQLVFAVNYIHSRTPSIAHLNIKPCNIWLNSSTFPVHAKLAEFGNAIDRDSYQFYLKDREDLFNSDRLWHAPELLVVTDNANNVEDFKILLSADIYSLGLVGYYTVFGQLPIFNDGDNLFIDKLKINDNTCLSTVDQQLKTNNVEDSLSAEFLTNESRGLKLMKNFLQQCLNKDWYKRGSAGDLLIGHEFEKPNPFLKVKMNAEFFSRGFIKETRIFVLDSSISESFSGCLKNNKCPQGYKIENIECEVEFKSWHQSLTKYDFLLVLKDLKIDRPGEEESQVLDLKFKAINRSRCNTFAKHWTKIGDYKRNKTIASKNMFDDDYNSSFHICLSILRQNDETGNKEIAIIQSNTQGNVKYSCGLSEILPYYHEMRPADMAPGKSDFKISLFQTIAKLLKEHCSVDLSCTECSAICLLTLFFDFHVYQWGICGVIDLTNPAIFERNKEFRLTKSDQSVQWVDFELKTVVDFVHRHLNQFEDCSKLAIVNTLEAYYGICDVEKDFLSH